MRNAIFVALVTSLALVACSGEGRDWRSAEAADTVESYDHFIERHPESEHAEQARARLAQLGEDRDWQRATGTDTAAAYREFLVQHPNGKWAGEARIRVENFALTTAPAPNDTPTPAVSRVQPLEPAAQPDSPAVTAATAPAPARAASSSPAPASGSEFGVQLGAFSSDAAAQAEWQNLQARHPAQLRSLKPQVRRAASASGTVFRLQAAVGAEARARGICSALAQASQPCVVVLPPR
jgi:hypothetical protein